MTSLQFNLYLANQIVDILLWSWVFLIMVKRVICRRELSHNHHFYSSICVLFASIIAVTQFGDQLYSVATHTREISKPLTRTFIWMIFHKFITASIIIKYKNSQPRLFYNIGQEIKSLFTKKQIQV